MTKEKGKEEFIINPIKILSYSRDRYLPGVSTESGINSY